MATATGDRVAEQTHPTVNRSIDERTTESVRYYLRHPEEIDERLVELEQEWDIERTLEANASTLAFAGVVLGVTVDRRFLAVPAIVTAFLFQHATQGWCPPLPVLRRLGFRSEREIAQEYYALKAVRGDFAAAATAKNKLPAVLRAVGIATRKGA
jgi:hypothetical protein